MLPAINILTMLIIAVYIGAKVSLILWHVFFIPPQICRYYNCIEIGLTAQTRITAQLDPNRKVDEMNIFHCAILLLDRLVLVVMNEIFCSLVRPLGNFTERLLISYDPICAIYEDRRSWYTIFEYTSAILLLLSVLVMAMVNFHL